MLAGLDPHISAVGFLDPIPEPEPVAASTGDLERFLMSDEVENQEAEEGIGRNFFDGLFVHELVTESDGSNQVRSFGLVEKDRETERNSSDDLVGKDQQKERDSGDDSVQKDQKKERDSDDDPVAKKIRRDSAKSSRKRKKHYMKELGNKSRSLKSECKRLNYSLQCFMAEDMALRQTLHSKEIAAGKNKKSQCADVAIRESAVLFLGSMASWTDLPVEIVECILKRIETPLDFLNFGAVCKRWHSISEQNYDRLPESLPICNFYPKARPLPMLLVPMDSALQGEPYLYSITDKKTYSFPFGSIFRDKWMVGSVKGWLVTANVRTGSIALLNPLTTKQIALPWLYSFDKPLSKAIQHEADDCSYVRKATALFDASGKPENSIIVAVVSSMKRICFCRVGDDEWRTVEHSPVHIHDIINFEGKLFAVDDAGRLFRIEIGGHVKWTLVAGELESIESELYLVESGNQILLVARYIDFFKRTAQFRVFKLVESESKYQVAYNLEDRSRHVMNGVQFKWVELESIGEHMIFLGYNHSLSLDSREYPGCRGNRVYFADYVTDIYFTRFFFRWP